MPGEGSGQGLSRAIRKPPHRTILAEPVLALIPLFGTLLVNVIPLVGVVWFGWNVFEVLLLYWFENVAIGIAHAVRLEICARTNAVVGGRSTAMFFVMHYGIFTAVHGIFVFVFFGLVGGGLGKLTVDFAGPVAGIVAWQVIFLFIDNWQSAGFRGHAPDAMMFEPYPRVFALHTTVIAGGWLLTEFGSPVWALAILVGVKSLFDLGVASISSMRSRTTGNVVAALSKRGD
jgi:Family of unknown function (DUF6498)